MADDNGFGVIFDNDGVLVDTAEFHEQAWFMLAEREGFAFSSQVFKETFGQRNDKIIPILVEGEISDDEICEMSDWKEARFRDIAKGKLTSLDGVQELLDDLKKHGFKIGIGSSTPRANLDLVLDSLGIAESFDECVTGEEIVNGKPAPDTFLLAAEKLSLPPERCVVVEDAVPGVESGQAAGMKVIAVTNTRSREALAMADRVVDSLRELRAGDFLELLR